MTKIVKLYNATCPVKNVTVKEHNNDKPWITTGLKNACKKKNQLYLKFLRTRNYETETRYKTYKNKLTSILRRCERDYYSNLLEVQSSNIKETWKILNSIIKKRKTHSEYPDTFIHENKSVDSKMDISNGFNKFFVNIGPNLEKNIPNIANTHISDYMKERKNNSMFIGGVTEYDVMKVVNNLKKKVSKDCNDIDMTIIKTIIYEIVTPFTYICNQSFLSGTFPNKMKLAKVIPLYKTGKQNAFTNYRPVSLLPQFSKILEKLFSEQLDVFIEKQNILCESQYGFRSNRSTSMALLELIEEITSAVDNKKCTIGVFIDLKKAFDTIDHRLLLTKLEHYGIRGVAYDWIKSYQYVSVNSCNSEAMNVVCGVPQGSILGPKLFILYVNDIANVSSLLRFVLFADDTNIFLSGDDAKEISNTLSI